MSYIVEEDLATYELHSGGGFVSGLPNTSCFLL
jgi:hypothetical protein